MKIYRYSLENTPVRVISAGGDDVLPGNPDIEEADPALPPLENPGIIFSFQSVSVPGYGTRRPASRVEFAFPADDAPRVQAWFSGNFDRVSLPESETLRKNRRNAVLDCLERYYTAARNADFFTAPFRIGWRFRMRDGSYQDGAAPMVLYPNPEAPAIIVTAYSLGDKWLSTDVELTNTPGRLMVAWSRPADYAEWAKRAEAVEFFITRQVEFHSSDAGVTGLRTLTIEGIPCRCWTYNAYPAGSLGTAAAADSDFRLIGELPVERFASASSPVPLPFAAGALRLFDSLPKPATAQGGASGDSGSGGAGLIISPDNPSKEPRRVRLVSGPVCMNLPEAAKQVRDLYLRGVFRREDVRLALYGSHHRENWRLLCRSSRPWIRGLCRARYRWFRVQAELTLAPGDFLEALTFRFDLFS